MNFFFFLFELCFKVTPLVPVELPGTVLRKSPRCGPQTLNGWVSSFDLFFEGTFLSKEGSKWLKCVTFPHFYLISHVFLRI